MDRQWMVRTGVFHDRSSTRRAIAAAKLSGFARIHVITDDPTVESDLRAEIGSDPRLLSWSPLQIAGAFGLGGAGIGFVLGLVASVVFSATGVGAGLSGLVLPGTGAIFGGFVGVMVSRGFTFDVERFYDQELGSDEFIVAIESSSPARLALAGKILSGEKRAPIALPLF